MEDNFIVLAMCILSEKYLMPEKAYAHYRLKSPLAGGKIPLRSWYDEDLRIEMNNMVDIVGSKRKAADLYGIHPTNFSRLLKGVDYNNEPIWFLKVGR